MEILVFKTSLSNNGHVQKVKSIFDEHPHIKDWNVDLHDCDNILRIITENIPAGEIEMMVLRAGYSCKELE